MILLATEHLEQSKRMALQVVDIMNLCSDLTRKGQDVYDSLDALLKRLTATDAFSNVMAFPYRLSVQQMMTHLSAQAATGKTANDFFWTFTRHLLIQSHRVTYLTSDEVSDRVTQGRIPGSWA
jgi:hypothetical protein